MSAATATARVAKKKPVNISQRLSSRTLAFHALRLLWPGAAAVLVVEHVLPMIYAR